MSVTALRSGIQPGQLGDCDLFAVFDAFQNLDVLVESVSQLYLAGLDCVRGVTTYALFDPNT